MYIFLGSGLFTKVNLVLNSKYTSEWI